MIANVAASFPSSPGLRPPELSMLARTFLRAADGHLRVGIYYSSWLIEQLEKNDPRSGLSDANIAPLIAFVEEIDHALHAALRFQQGHFPVAKRTMPATLNCRPRWIRILVLLLFVAFFRKPGRITRADRRWLRFHMFESRIGQSFRDRTLAARYAETTLLAKDYTRFLEGLADARRVEEIRVFHALDYDKKRERILALMDRAAWKCSSVKTFF